MNLPGFQAEASLETPATRGFAASGVTSKASGSVVPQVCGCSPCIRLLGFGRKVCCCFPPLSCSIKSC